MTHNKTHRNQFVAIPRKLLNKLKQDFSKSPATTCLVIGMLDYYDLYGEWPPSEPHKLALATGTPKGHVRRLMDGLTNAGVTQELVDSYSIVTRYLLDSYSVVTQQLVSEKTNDINGKKPYTNTTNQTKETYSLEFENFWVSYGRTGDKKAAFRVWSRMSKTKRAAAVEGVAAYFKFQPNKTYRKATERYLRCEVWDSDDVKGTPTSTAHIPDAIF